VEIIQAEFVMLDNGDLIRVAKIVSLLTKPGLNGDDVYLLTYEMGGSGVDMVNLTKSERNRIRGALMNPMILMEPGQ
jgi:hypothetical protein